MAPRLLDPALRLGDHAALYRTAGRAQRPRLLHVGLLLLVLALISLGLAAAADPTRMPL
jgi:hypothetical protein